MHVALAYYRSGGDLYPVLEVSNRFWFEPDAVNLHGDGAALALAIRGDYSNHPTETLLLADWLQEQWGAGNLRRRSDPQPAAAWWEEVFESVRLRASA